MATVPPELQEWIVREPAILGEELLIIQKEFSGFSDTNERLDLLAIDRKGNLVIIENKLDDSGKDVTWQAMKYASYCSTLGKEGIRKIYQDYLNKTEPGVTAEDIICDFLRKKLFAKLYLVVTRLIKPPTNILEINLGGGFFMELEQKVKLLQIVYGGLYENQ